MSDIILCCLLLPSNQIVVGGKDGQLVVYHLNGERLCTLKGHNASICSLALVRCDGLTYLASGSDHGCSTILLWELPSLTLRHRLEGHKAAVTAIVDLLDGQNIVSGSYDKKINVYNIKNGKTTYSVPNKASVTGIVLNNVATKMISCGLDNTLSVWNIIRSQHSNNVQILWFRISKIYSWKDWFKTTQWSVPSWDQPCTQTSYTLEQRTVKSKPSTLKRDKATRPSLAATMQSSKWLSLKDKVTQVLF